MTRDDESSTIWIWHRPEVPTGGTDTRVIHRHEYNLSSILRLSVDGVGCASDISFEAGWVAKQDSAKNVLVALDSVKVAQPPRDRSHSSHTS